DCCPGDNVDWRSWGLCDELIDRPDIPNCDEISAACCIPRLCAVVRTGRNRGLSHCESAFSAGPQAAATESGNGAELLDEHDGVARCRGWQKETRSPTVVAQRPPSRLRRSLRSLKTGPDEIEETQPCEVLR